MHNKFTPAFIGIIVIGAMGGLAYWQDQKDSSSQPVAEVSEDAAQIQYSAEDVANHSMRGDCWTVINGGVYDLTSWIPRHPGGEKAIEGLCGKDGSAAFNAQHGGGAAQQVILTERKIGVTK